jgi:glycosyltransferase involved in cell wall biosynthesis
LTLTKRLLIVSHRDIRHYDGGGAPLYVHEIFKRLTASYDITILSTLQGKLPSSETLDGIRIVRLPSGQLARLVMPMWLVARFAREADIIVDNADIGFPWLTPLFSRKPKLSIIYQVARDIFRYELARPLSVMAMRVEPWVYRVYKSNRIVTCSPSTRDDLIRSGISSKNVTVIRPGVGDSFLKFQPNGLKFEDPTIVCISRFKRYKGLGYAVAAMKHVLERIPSARLIIVGNGDSSELQREISKGNYGKSVEILHRAPNMWNEEKKTLLSKSHLLLVPSIREGYGIVVIEANACGTPAIGWAVPGVQDSILDGKTGLLVPFGDVHALARTITKCLSESQIIGDLSGSAIDWARKHSWDVAARQFGEVIDSL